MKRGPTAFLILVLLCGFAIVTAIFVTRRNLGRQSIPPRPVAQTAEGDIRPPASVNPAAHTVLPEKRATPRPSAGGKVKRPQGAGRPEQQQQTPALLFFRANARDENYGRLAVTSTDAIDRIQYSADLKCSRVHFARGVGVCLVLEKLGPNYAISSATSFDQTMKRGWTTRVMGVPSRVRVSPSGRLAAVTLFRFGESYASLNFSTQTSILDAGTGKVLTELEQFSVTREGQEFKSPDFNFWGVTFTNDENIFYATLWSKNKIFLVKGDFANRSAAVIRESVECPSLSPDGTRIAFKKRIEGKQLTWRLTLLDLRTSAETSLGESRSVDDQVEWLDNNRLLYSLSPGNPTFGAIADIWVLPTNPDSSPRLFIQGAFSPAVFRSQNSAGLSKMSLLLSGR